jgi:tetratricopeptide (TPR) repeat protein
MKAIAVIPLVALSLALGCASVVVDEEQDIPRMAEARRNVGMDHLANGRTAMAVRDLMEAERLNPGDHETELWLGEAFRRKGLFEKAEDRILRALDLKPGHHLSRMNLAGLYIQMERYHDAIEILNGLVDDPTFQTPWRALSNRGWAEYKLGRVSDARASLESALDYRTDFWPALLNLGILENSQGHRLEAIERFRKVLEGSPGRRAKAEANYRIGEVFVSLGRRDRAISHFASAIENSPEGTWGERSKEYLKLLR